MLRAASVPHCRSRLRAAIHSAVLLLIVLATVSISLGQAAGQGLQAEEQPGSVQGTVVNAVTGAPISRALVYSPDNRFAMLTDGEGHFEFALPKVDRNSGRDIGVTHYNGGGYLGLSARKPGFLNDPSDRREIETTSVGQINIRIPLLPEALIKGRVIVSDADPALGMNVQLFSRQVIEGIFRWSPAGTARANSNGEFRFAELLPGEYKLGTSELMDNDPAITVPGGQMFGYPPVYFPGVTDFAAAGIISVTAGQTVQADIPLTRQPYYPVRIPVANPDVNGAMNITVSVQGHRGPGYSLGYNVEKGIDGMLPNGNYLVEATTFGQNAGAGAVHLVVAGAPTEGPALTLVPNSSITIHVTEQFTATESNGVSSWSGGGRSFRLQGPRSYLQVNAEPADDFEHGGASLRRPTGQNDDSLVIENLSPGRYWLRPRTARGYVAAATMGGVDLLHQPFVVAAGSSMPIEITMRDDTAELDGTVAGLAPPPSTDSSASFAGQSSQGWVYCIPLPDSPGQYQQVWVSPDGKFTSAAMAPGTYRLLAFKNQQLRLPWRDPDAMRAYESKGQVVHLSAGQKTSVQLQILSGSE